ncbi:MAG: sugar ABC transporter substrate-binding protein, partial [Pseudobutyrivibrio sp.]|nr:sugar ABC transporter substrate-binding protein [Pseudobutyrivibrio sp.]
DNDGNAVSLSQGYLVATDVDSFNQYYVTDNGDTPIYDKESLDSIIGDSVTFENIKTLVESK